ncbi:MULTISPECIES: helix-turn-helix transcriptional regulator [unclassified Streptomyces]|uniref:helix-turn-helix domain-containing protein n=1 Tax=unclassified Streptomyces TaxID=2593676 RepID=UPI0003A65569|nr:MULTISPECIES: helix-turn-helix transcriptional regulator [unclassified Streptomyces]MYX39060.1 helix-turn-helix domain-containing protein [Streptomyces sp. SID8377]
MPEDTETHIGRRLREIRKRRGLSQRELATASRVSLSLIRQLEQGVVEGTRLQTAHKLATALRVTTSQLLTRDDQESPESPAEPWRALRLAVESPASEPDEEPTIAGMRAALDEVRTAFFANRMGEVSLLLAPLLRDADALGDTGEGRTIRAHLLNLAGSTLTQARQFSAAETALTRALDDANDRLRSASVITTWTWLLVRQGRVAEARQLAIRWADEVEPRMSRATADDLAAWGWLLLQVSSASLRDARAGEAQDAMRLARSAAVLTGRELPLGDSRLATWGPVTVAYKEAERGIVMDRPDEVLVTAKKLEQARQARATKGGTEYHRHRLDVAQAHTMMREYGDAVTVLTEVRQAAPEWLAQQRYAQDIVSTIIERRRTLTPDMRSLADAVGLPA